MSDHAHQSADNAAILQHLESTQPDTTLSPVPDANPALHHQVPGSDRSKSNSAVLPPANHVTETPNDDRTMAPHLNRNNTVSSASNQRGDNNNNTGNNTNKVNAAGELITATNDGGTSNVVICGECGKDAATFECLDCAGEWYCRPCAISVHSKGRRKNHAQFKEHPICDICRSRIATVICEKCDEVYCSTKCAYGAHDGSPRNGSKKRLHQWASLPSDGLSVQRPPHLEHAVDTRGGRNPFGIALAELNLSRYDGIDDDLDEVDGFLDDDLGNNTGGAGGGASQNDGGMIRNSSSNNVGLSGSTRNNNRRTSGQDPMSYQMRDESRLSHNKTPQLGDGDSPVPPSDNDVNNNNNSQGVLVASTSEERGQLETLANALHGTNNNSQGFNNNNKDNGMLPEEKIAMGKATEMHFPSDSPAQNVTRARGEIRAAVAARNLPPPDLDEVVTVVTSADGKSAGGPNDKNNTTKNATRNQGHGGIISNSVRGAKAAQLITEKGFALVPPSNPIPERLLIAGLTDKLEAASKKRNEELLKRYTEGAARVQNFIQKIHGWRRWDVIHPEPAFFGSHSNPLIVRRPLPPLLPMITDISTDNDHENTEVGFPSYVPFFERTCHDEPFLLAVASVLASNGCQHVKTVRLEDGGEMENGVFTPRIRGGPVINVVAPGFDGPQQDDRQKKKKSLEKADAAMPCPIGDIFLTTFASCERLHDLGLATFRFYKPSTGEDIALGTERHLLAHRSAHKATNGVAPPVLDAVEHFVTVDTLFPVNQDGRPAFGRTDVPDEFWLTLLEKAYATMKGDEGFAALTGGSPVDPLFALCGGEPTQLQWNLQQLDSSAFTTTADYVSPLAMRARVVGLAWWMMQVATQYNLPISVTKRHDSKASAAATAIQNGDVNFDKNSTWYKFETGLDEVEKFDWKGGDVVFFAVNHTIDRNLVDAQQFLDDEDDRSSNKSGATSFNASFAASRTGMGMTTMSHAGTTFGIGGGGHAVQTGKEEHRLLKLRQLYNTSRNNDKADDYDTPLLPLWHDGSNKWSDIASRVSGTTGVAAFAARRAAGGGGGAGTATMKSSFAASNMMNSMNPDGTTTASGASNRRPPAGASVRGYAESVLSRKDGAVSVAGGAGGGANASSMWTKGTRKALQHFTSDERLTWMDIETFTQKYNTILIAQNLTQHKHQTFFGSIDMRIPEEVIAKNLPHYLVVVEKRELENSDEADDRAWAEGLDSQFKSISDIMKPPRNMATDLGIGDRNETDDAAEDGNAASNNDDSTSVASSQVSLAESLADMGTMGSRRSLVLRITVTQPTTKVDLNNINNSGNTPNSNNNTTTSTGNNMNMNADPAGTDGKGAASLMIDETREMMDALSSFKSVMQPEDLTLYAFRVPEAERQQITTSVGPKGEPVYSLPVHTKIPVNEITDPIAIGQVPQGLHQVTFELEANPGAYNFVVAPTRGMGRTDLGSSSVAQAHFSVHICSVRNGENFDVKAGRI